MKSKCPKINQIWYQCSSGVLFKIIIGVVPIKCIIKKISNHRGEYITDNNTEYTMFVDIHNNIQYPDDWILYKDPNIKCEKCKLKETK